MPRKLKVTVGDETRRGAADIRSLAEMRSAAASLFPEKDAALFASAAVKFLDEDGDWCTVMDDAQALEACDVDMPRLRLRIELAPEPSPEAKVKSAKKAAKKAARRASKADTPKSSPKPAKKTTKTPLATEASAVVDALLRDLASLPVQSPDYMARVGEAMGSLQLSTPGAAQRLFEALEVPDMMSRVQAEARRVSLPLGAMIASFVGPGGMGAQAARFADQVDRFATDAGHTASADLSGLFSALTSFFGAPTSSAEPKASADDGAGQTIHVGVECDCCGQCPIIGVRAKCKTCADYDLCGACAKTGVHSYHSFEHHSEPRRRTALHYGVVCDGCGQKPLRGNRFKCKECPDFDLCESCRESGVHAGTGHSFGLIAHTRRTMPGMCRRGPAKKEAAPTPAPPAEGSADWRKQQEAALQTFAAKAPAHRQAQQVAALKKFEEEHLARKQDAALEQALAASAAEAKAAQDRATAAFLASKEPAPLPKAMLTGAVEDVTLPEGASLTAGVEVPKIWRVTVPADSAAWPASTVLRFVHGNAELNPGRDVPVGAYAPGADVTIQAAVRAPRRAGAYSAAFQLFDTETFALFGEEFPLAFVVVDKPAVEEVDVVYPSLDAGSSAPPSPARSQRSSASSLGGFAREAAVLRSMGFVDDAMNQNFLERYNGNVDRVAAELLARLESPDDWVTVPSVPSSAAPSEAGDTAPLL